MERIDLSVECSDDNEDSVEPGTQSLPIRTGQGSSAATIEANSQVAKPKTRKRKLRSKYWPFFEMLPLSQDNRQRCKCNKCGVIYICESKYGTGNLKRHVET